LTYVLSAQSTDEIPLGDPVTYDDIDLAQTPQRRAFRRPPVQTDGNDLRQWRCFNAEIAGPDGRLGAHWPIAHRRPSAGEPQ